MYSTYLARGEDGSSDLHSADGLSIENDIEIERSYFHDPLFYTAAKAHLRNQGIGFVHSFPDSTYFETPGYQLLQHGLTLRFRKGGKSACGTETHQALYGVKYLHRQYQRQAVSLLGRSPLLKKNRITLTPNDNPCVRQEIEIPGPNLTGHYPLMGKNLPEEIRKIIGQKLKIDQRHVATLTFFPQFRSYADARRKVMLAFKPEDFLDNGRIVPFHQMQFSPFSHSRSLIRGTVCIELAFDACRFTFSNGIPSFMTQLSEPEIKIEYCKASLQDIFVGDFLLRQSLAAMDVPLARRYWKHDRRRPYMPLRPASSKARMGYNRIPNASPYASRIP